MQIRNRLSLQFTLFSSSLMLLSMLLIYLLFYRAGIEDFYHELKERTAVAAGVYLEADEISADALKKIQEQFIISLPSETIRIYDSTNQPVFIKDEGHPWSSATIEQVRKNKYLQYQQGKLQVVGIRYEDNQGSFIIMAAAIDVYGAERRVNLIRIMSALFVGQLLLLFFVGRLFAKNALLPIQNVNEQVKQITATDLHLRVNEGKGKDEISTLAVNFNHLLDRLEHAFDVQKMFVANASHELKTPITAIIGSIEVALRKQRTDLEYEAVLNDTLGDAERLHTIVDNLLLLATTESKAIAPVTDLICIDELLWEAKASFQKEGNKILNLSIENIIEDETKWCIHANRPLVLLALMNIMRNAFKFSDDREVFVVLRVIENHLQVSVRDSGMGISADALPDIFEPFYRSPATQQLGGHGIGLYIAEQIVKKYDGSITVVSAPGKGSVFNILFTRKTPF